MAHIDTELKMHTGRRLTTKYKHDKHRKISSYTKNISFSPDVLKIKTTQIK